MYFFFILYDDGVRIYEFYWMFVKLIVMGFFLYNFLFLCFFFLIWLWILWFIVFVLFKLLFEFLDLFRGDWILYILFLWVISLCFFVLCNCNFCLFVENIISRGLFLCCGFVKKFKFLLVILWKIFFILIFRICNEFGFVIYCLIVEVMLNVFYLLFLL